MKIAIVSGYFNPIHVGHIDYIQGAKLLGHKLWVIVNNDLQVGIKGSVPFMNEQDRIKIVGAIEGVDGVILSIDTDGTVLKTLKTLVKENQATGRNSFVFCNGGDRADVNSPEEEYCKNNSYYLTSAYNVGGGKVQSSSTLIKEASIRDRQSNDELKMFSQKLKALP